MAGGGCILSQHAFDKKQGNIVDITLGWHIYIHEQYIGKPDFAVLFYYYSLYIYIALIAFSKKPNLKGASRNNMQFN